MSKKKFHVGRLHKGLMHVKNFRRVASSQGPIKKAVTPADCEMKQHN